MVTRLADLFRSVVGDAPPWVLLTRLFFGLGWLRAATEKLIDPDWWSGAALLGFLDEHRDATLAWFAPFLDRVVVPHLDATVAAVVALQLVAGLALLSGRRLGVGLATGLTLNLVFVAAGAVNPSAFYIVAQGALACWLIEARPSPSSRRALVGGVGLLVLLGALSAPLVDTLHPDAVIDDPAAMLLTLAALAVVTAFETSRRHPPPRARDTSRHRQDTAEPDMMIAGPARPPTTRI